MLPLKNRTAVITGATGESGATLARDLAALQINLALISRDSTRLSTLIRRLNLDDRQVYPYVVDLLDPAAAQTAAAAIAARFGRVDILIHLVGGWIGGKTILDTPRHDLDAMIQQHVWSSFNSVQAFLPYMMKNDWGRLLMVSSPSAVSPSVRGGAYAIAKAGQEALVMTLAQELKGSGVTANLLVVKMIDVERQKVRSPSTERAAWTTPEELSKAVMFLLSDEGGAVNGARIPLYGG